jgi:hypothetical protein
MGNSSITGALISAVVNPIEGVFQGFEQSAADIKSAIPSGGSSGTVILVLILGVAAVLIGTKIAGKLVI